MHAKRIRIFMYALTAVLQVGIAGGAWGLVVLSKRKMMVMRYLFAKNLILDKSVFSPPAVIGQTIVLAVVAVALLVVAVMLTRRHAAFAVVQSAIGMLVAGGAAWFLGTVSVASLVAAHAVVLALWVVLVLQLAVVVFSVRAWRRHS